MFVFASIDVMDLVIVLDDIMECIYDFCNILFQLVLVKTGAIGDQFELLKLPLPSMQK